MRPLAESIQAPDWQSVSLLGIDVGFSRTAKSTGIAVYDRGRLRTLTCVGSSMQDRADILRDHPRFDAIAIDGPIVFGADQPPAARTCEAVLSRGAFNRRCKPGLSHFGFGLPLRQAATAIAADMQTRVKSAGRIVEAFPNAFLGVLLGDDDFAALGPIRRGNKSDAYYARLAAHKGFDPILDLLGWRDDTLRATIHDVATDGSRAAHDQRAALVCLLTAACALSGAVDYVGDEAGGFICLPPKGLWAPWARAALPPSP